MSYQRIPDFIPVALRNGRWNADLVEHRRIIAQLRREAGLTSNWPDPPDAYDRILFAAGAWGIGLETIEHKTNQ